MRAPRALAVFGLGAALALAAGSALERESPSLPSLAELPRTPFVQEDAALASAGLRAVAADLAWVQMLQYAGGGIPELTDPPRRPYHHLQDLSLRAARLDPAFHRAYLYGAGVLGWLRGVERVDEAVDILRECLRRDPAEPLCRTYLAAMAYKRKGDNARMLALLDASFDDPRAPTRMRVVLANLYKARSDLARALELWEKIRANPRDEAEHPRAVQQIEELRQRLRERPGT
ncbi:MAG: hypothetical protein HY552_01890 [Elusimicrobia bacterium]|nr:hypothetical protein [Elusimicrobiota bacterium]